MDWARILAYVTGTVDQELLLRNEYLATENRILKARDPAAADHSHGSQAASNHPQAATAGAAIKKAFPLVVVTVVDTEEHTTEIINA